MDIDQGMAQELSDRFVTNAREKEGGHNSTRNLRKIQDFTGKFP